MSKSRGGRGVDKPNGRLDGRKRRSAGPGVVRSRTARRLNRAMFDPNGAGNGEESPFCDGRHGDFARSRRAELPTFTHRASCLLGTGAVDEAWTTPAGVRPDPRGQADPLPAGRQKPRPPPDPGSYEVHDPAIEWGDVRSERRQERPRKPFCDGCRGGFSRPPRAELPTLSPTAPLVHRGRRRGRSVDNSGGVCPVPRNDLARYLGGLPAVRWLTWGLAPPCRAGLPTLCPPRLLFVGDRHRGQSVDNPVNAPCH